MLIIQKSCIVSNTKLPVPHLEHPKSGDEYPLRVSFMDQQTVQTGSTVFMTQLSYRFDHWDGTRPLNLGESTFAEPPTDCIRFQELLLGSKLIFIGGMAEAKSKGRGEECISQNLRILRGHNGKRVMLFFANSQRRELKRYVSIPCKLSHFYLGPYPPTPCHSDVANNPSELHRFDQTPKEARAASPTRSKSELRDSVSNEKSYDSVP